MRQDAVSKVIEPIKIIKYLKENKAMINAWIFRILDSNRLRKLY